MDPHKKQGTVIYKFFVDKLGGNSSETFVGEEGHIFYDPTLGDLRLSDDKTPGGIPLLQLLMSSSTGNTVVNPGNTTPTPTPGANTVVYNNTAFESMGVINYGNVKYGFQLTDHFGWILLNGRSLTTLTADQQAIAAQLGWTVGIPNMVGYLPKMSGQNPGAVGGLINNRYNITQAQLPNVTLSGIATGLKQYRKRDVIASINDDNPDVQTDEIAPYSAAVAVNLNPTSQIQTNVENQYMALNAFVYLGL